MNEKTPALLSCSRRYRSPGEARLADLFDRLGLAYRYEAPLAVIDRGKVRIWYPDFHLPDYSLLVEYCGVKGDPQYDASCQRKQSVYEANGLTALVWTPELFQGDWPTRLLDGIEGTLVERLNRFRAARCAGTVKGADVATCT